jgi:UDP-GlcNAc:undecaprenyl-phosphate GlcNAc-1-phosphate transferase
VPFLTSKVVLGAALGLLAGLACIGLVGPRGWMDHPDVRKRHPEPTALTGGLALWAMVALGQGLGWLPLPLDRQDWLAVHGMALMGALDDRFGLRARWKALAGLLAALFLGLHAARDLLAHGGSVHVAYLDLPNRLAFTAPLAVAWFWGIPQAFNLIDGLNGLSLGLTALLLGLLGWGAGSEAALLVGAVLGALLLNYPRARHFIGDCGAFLLGTLLAILALKRGLPAHPNLALWAFAYPILDVTVVVAIRLARRQGLAIADHNHLHDWMIARLGGGPWARPLATPLLLLLAAGPMLHELPWRHGQTAGLVGLIVLIAVGIDQFRIGLGAPLPEKDEDDGPSMNGALPENTRAS